MAAVDFVIRGDSAAVFRDLRAIRGPGHERAAADGRAEAVEGNNGTSTTATLAYDGEIADIDMALDGQGAVEGYVLDSLCQTPVDIARVTIFSGSPYSGGTVTRVRPDEDGLIDPDALAAALQPDTVLVSVMAAQNEIGTLQPVAEIGRICKRSGVMFVSVTPTTTTRSPSRTV